MMMFPNLVVFSFMFKSYLFDTYLNILQGIDESSFENSSTSHVSTQDTQIVLSQCNKNLEVYIIR